MPLKLETIDGHHLRKHIADMGHDALNLKTAADVDKFIEAAGITDPAAKAVIKLLAHRSVVLERRIVVLEKKG